MTYFRYCAESDKEVFRLLFYLHFALYIDGVISELKLSGHGVHIGSLFIGCVLYADNIVLLSASCHGLQQLVNICNVIWYKMGYKV